VLEVGSIVEGYRIDGVLGEGGMGVVYRATQLSLNRTVALKVLPDALSADETFRERFRREGQLQAAIDHPHIVTVYEAGDTEHGLFLAMRMVRGPTLKDEIISKRLTPDRAMRILVSVAEALDAAHEVGLIHRDVKPQNILVGAGDHAYLADFGLTKIPDEEARLTGTGQFIGTIDYVSPEQVRGEGADPRSDVYALAGVLYESLIGTVPFERPTEAAVLYAHMMDPPPKVTDARPDLPAELDDVIARGMAKDPDDRPSTPGELIGAARIAFGDTVAEAIPAPAPPRTGPEDRAAPTAPAAAHGTGATAPAAIPGNVTRQAGALTAPAAGMTVPAGAATVPAGAVSAPPAPPAEEPRAPARPRGFFIALGVLVVAAAAAGLLIGGSGSSSGSDGEEAPALTSSASASGLELSFPDDWTRGQGGAQIPGLPLNDITLAAQGQQGSGLQAGMTNGSGVTLLPKAFLATLPSEPKGEPVKMGKFQAYRYAGLKPQGSSGALTVYTVPSSGGVATTACQATAANADAFLPECERVAASLQLTGVKAIPLGPSDEYASAVSKTLGTLDTARSSGEQKLKAAGSQKAQADAAHGLADSYGKAAGSMRTAPFGPAERTANEAIVASMSGVQHAYGRLGSAAANNDSGAYKSASSAVQKAETRLNDALKQLTPLGYQVT
jgi:serine/threonine-protein kinase